MMEIFQRALRKLKFWLLEETEDAHMPNAKRRKQLHNATLIQSWAALTGITVMAIVPLVIWLITIQGFVLAYVILSVVALVLYVTISLHVRRLNKRAETGEEKPSAPNPISAT